MRTALTLIVIVYVLFCGWLVIETGIFDGCFRGGEGPILLQQTTGSEPAEPAGAPEPNGTQVKATERIKFGANHAPARTVILGSPDRASGYKFAIELDSMGSGIRTATFSEFDDRDPDDPQQLVIMSPVKIISPIDNREREILALANTSIVWMDICFMIWPI